MARVHEVTVVAACWNDTEREAATYLGTLPGVSIVIVPLSKIGAVTRSLAAIFTKRSLAQAYVDSKAMRRQLSRAGKEFKPDVVYFNVLRTAQFSSAVADVPRVIDLDEFRSRYYEQVSVASHNPMARLTAWVESKRMKAEESRITAEFERILVSSPAELRGAMPHVVLVRSPHVLGEVPIHIRREPETIVFVGRMSYRANVEAIRWFHSIVMPLIWQANPEVRLLIVGDSPPMSVRALASHRVEVTGQVEDVAHFYGRATVAIAPITMATGVQMKVIEALHLGVPLVATGTVARAAGLSNGQQCLIADNPTEWAQGVLRIMAESALAERLKTFGTEWIRQHYEDGRIDKAVLQVLYSVQRSDHRHAG